MYRPPSLQPRKRRYWLAVVAIAIMAGAARAESPARPQSFSWDASAARHLLSRTSFGGTPEEAQKLADLPVDKAVARLLDEATAAKPPARPEWARDVWINSNRRWSDMSAEEYLIVLRRTSARTAAEMNQLRAWWVDQMIHTETPLKGMTKLRRLELGHTAIDDDSVKELSGLGSLTTLDLFQTKVTDAAARQLQKALPTTRISK